MTDINLVPPKMRDEWRHELNHAAHRLSTVREALGVLGAVNPRGSLEGLAVDLETARRQITALQIAVAAELRLLGVEQSEREEE